MVLLFMNIKNIKFGFVFQLVAILSLIIIYIFQWGVMITTPSLRTGTDFIIFYSAGRIAQEYGIENTYKVLLQQKVQEEVLGFQLGDKQVLVYNHIPYLIPILSLFVSENYVASFMIWVGAMLSIYIVASLLLSNALKVEEKINFNLGVLLFYPLFQSLLLGQDTALLFLGCIVWYSGLIKEKKWLTAIGLALLSIRPHLCLVFAIPFILFDSKIRWKFLLSIGLLILISINLLSWEGVIDFLSILKFSASGTWYGFQQNTMFNLIGFTARSMPLLGENFIRITGWIGYFCAIIFLCIMWRKKQENINGLVCLTIILSLFFAPHLHYHDLTLLIIPLVILFIKHKSYLSIILGISIMLLFLKPLYYILPYVLYIYLFLKIKNLARHYNKSHAN